MAEAFYEKSGDQYVATELTRGPWDPNAQHAGPPAALLGRAIEAVGGGEEFQVGRVTFEILKSVPIGPVRVEAEVVRPGRSVQLVEASLSSEAGALVRARAWRLRTAPIGLPEGISEPAPPPGPEQGSEPAFFATGDSVGYHTAMEWRAISGEFLEPGPATVWMRMRHPLLAGEEPSPLQRTLIAADVGNGISAPTSSSTSTSPSISSACRGGNGSASTRSPCRSRTGSAPPSRSSPTPRAGSAAPPRRCSSASADPPTQRHVSTSRFPCIAWKT